MAHRVNSDLCLKWSQSEGAFNWSTQHFILNAKMECLMMGQRYRRGFTATEKTELWDRWRRGESLKAIGRAFGKPSSSIYFQVAPHGGIRPAVPTANSKWLTHSCESDDTFFR